MAAEEKVDIRRESDIVLARQKGRDMAAELGFSRTEQTLIATAISEIARNILVYAQVGQVTLGTLNDAGRVGILIVATDEGPGIADVDLALRDGYSTANSLGMGLPGARRLMDEFEIQSALGKGTRVSMRKWRT